MWKIQNPSLSHLSTTSVTKKFQQYPLFNRQAQIAVRKLQRLFYVTI